MGFYGKIYEQAVNIFNRLRFKNTNEKQFPEGTLDNELVLRADGGEAAATISAGNKWIQFSKNEDLECKIYHAKSDLKSNLDIMTLSGSDNIINYGDTITIQSPQFDESGHITGYKSKEFKMVVIENFTSIQNAINDIASLKKAIGDVDTYNGEVVLSRLETLDANLGTVLTIANEAKTAAQNALNQSQQALNTVDSANKAAADATEAAMKAEEATTNANNNLVDLQTKIQVLNDELLELKSRVSQLENQ